MRETVPNVLPPSRSPPWPSVNRTDNPEECHIMAAPPTKISEQQARQQSSRSMVPLLLSSHKGLLWYGYVNGLLLD
jgi:hypothetical protein